MPFYVYIIQSKKDSTFYKGSSDNPKRRLKEHNDGVSQYTSAKTPWELVYVEELATKKDMLIRERKLKRGNSTYFKQLIADEKNLANRFV